MKNIVMYSVFQLYKRKHITLITIVMVVVSFCIMGYYIFDYFAIRAGEFYAKKYVTYDEEEIYRIDISKYIVCNVGEDRVNAIYDFYDAVKSMDGIEGCGAYYLDTYAEIDNVVYVYGDVMEIFGLKLEDYCSDGDNTYGCVWVGSELADEYAVNSNYISSFDGLTYNVTGIIPPDVGILSDSFYTYGEIVKLDDRVVVKLDDTECSKLMLPMCLNNFYFALEKDSDIDEVINRIHEIGKEYDIDINGIISLEHMFDENVYRIIESAGQTYLLPFVMLLSSIIGLIISTMISIKTNKRDSGIMIANGMTIREVSGIYFFENILRVIIGVIASFIYCNKKMIEEFGRYQEIFKLAVCVYILMALLVVIISNVVIVLYFNKKMPCALIGEAND